MTGTKKKIFEASTELFAMYGYDDVSMRDIAAKVGITDGAIYRHYKSKASILDDISDEFKQKINAWMSPLEKEQIDKYFETATPRQILERCILRLSKSELQFVADAFRITLREHLVRKASYELVIYLIHDRIAERIKYILDRLAARGDIPELNTASFSLLWARFMLSTAIIWVSRTSNNLPPEEATVGYVETLSWLVELALGNRGM